MSPSRTSALTLAVAATSVLAQSGVYTLTDSTTTTVYTVTQDTGGDVPLASKHFEYPHLPYHADSGDGPRGTQQGYNICNSTTLGSSSWCQTGWVNSIDDFCLWGSPDGGNGNQTVANEEEELVAYCTTATHGTRVIPPGALTGVQFITTPDYVEVVGYIDQTKLGLEASDYGGEEDPHGADQRGNPLGSLVYSTAFNSSGPTNATQVLQWSYFIGGGIFCYKACDPAGPRAAELCQHTYDRIGCTYNDPADYGSINGTFTSCQGDDQLPVGQYVTNGVTSTYYQPPESLGVISTIPYTPSIPATSQCSTYTSSNLYTALANYYSSVSPASSAPTAGPTTSSGAAKGLGSAPKAANTTSGASTLTVSLSAILAAALIVPALLL